MIINTGGLGSEQEAGRQEVEKFQRLDVFKADAFNVMCPNLIFGAFLVFHCVVQYKLVFLKMLVVTLAAAAAAKSLQSCPTLCDPRDGSPPGSPVLGILQARTLEWVAISFSNT